MERKYPGEDYQMGGHPLLKYPNHVMKHQKKAKNVNLTILLSLLLILQNKQNHKRLKLMMKNLPLNKKKENVLQKYQKQMHFLTRKNQIIPFKGTLLH